MAISFSCKICGKIYKVAGYNNCKLWVQIKCNKINKQTYNLLIEDDTASYCIKCTKSIFHLNDIENNELHSITQGKKQNLRHFWKRQIQINTL